MFSFEKPNKGHLLDGMKKNYEKRKRLIKLAEISLCLAVKKSKFKRYYYQKKRRGWFMNHPVYLFACVRMARTDDSSLFYYFHFKFYLCV